MKVPNFVWFTSWALGHLTKTTNTYNPANISARKFSHQGHWSTSLRPLTHPKHRHKVDISIVQQLIRRHSGAGRRHSSVSVTNLHHFNEHIRVSETGGVTTGIQFFGRYAHEREIALMSGTFAPGSSRPIAHLLEVRRFSKTVSKRDFQIVRRLLSSIR